MTDNIEAPLLSSTNKTCFLTMVLVLGCPSVLVLPKEKPVVWVVVGPHWLEGQAQWSLGMAQGDGQETEVFIKQRRQNRD